MKNMHKNGSIKTGKKKTSENFSVLDREIEPGASGVVLLCVLTTTLRVRNNPSPVYRIYLV